jgi:WD40 repeat protein
VAQIWAADGAPFGSLGEHAGEITSVVWSSDSAQFLTTSSTGLEGSARLWTSDGTLLATFVHRSPVVSGGFGPGDTHVRTATASGELREWLIDPTALLRGFWLSTPQCIDASERQRVLAETHADAEFGAATCRAMQTCLRDDAGRAVPERLEPCLTEFHARRDTHG